MKKNIVVFLLGILTWAGASAQQDPMYSMYFFNGLAINPAYAGSREAMSFTLLGRRQWFGVPGAPITQVFSGHTPIADGRSGLGLSFSNDKISYLGQSWINGAYSFRIPIGEGHLALGVQGTVGQYRIKWEEAYTIDPNDATVGTYGRNMLLPNAGAGVYWSNSKWYAGASIPHLLINSLDINKPGVKFLANTQNLALFSRHFFFTAGAVFPLGDQVLAKPSFLLKYSKGAQPELDLNMSFLFKDRFWAGASWRTGDGALGVLEYQISRQFRAGYAYDFPFTQLGGYTSGTHEIMIGWDLQFKEDAARSPRLF